MAKRNEKLQEGAGGIRLGLCCIFRDEPIRFRATTAKYLLRFDRREQLQKLSGLCLQNTHNLLAALRFLQQNGIGAFRILSPFFPALPILMWDTDWLTCLMQKQFLLISGR
jgi:UV DNA damage repair endonuclease